MAKKLIIFLLIILMLALAVIISFNFIPALTNIEKGLKNIVLKSQSSSAPYQIVAENLQIPWEIVLLPDGDMLVTERTGQLKRIGSDNQTIKIDNVEAIGEGGLLGLALHPKFVENHWLYLYLTSKDNNQLINRVIRFRFENDQLLERQVILDNIPANQYHNGGRLAFGPDGDLYITTGDSEAPSLAQDTQSLAGKILRIKDDGSIPSDNPFNNPVYSYGHRNAQGLAWDDQGRLWATEHGPSGNQTGYDELNLIGKGKNYGWPIILGDQTKPGLVSPVIQSGSTATWAPAGAVFYRGSILFTGLKGESLYRAKIINNSQVKLNNYLTNELGRLRAAVIGPDNFLYLSTSNTDGRGQPRPGDDKIIKINLNNFN